MPGVIQSPMWAPGLNTSHPLANGLRAYWPIWEGDGDKVMDLVNDHHVTLNNMDPPTDWVPTPDGLGLAFDGVNDYGQAAGNIDESANLTVWVWLKAAAIGATLESIVAKNKTVGDQRSWFLCRSDPAYGGVDELAVLVDDRGDFAAGHRKWWYTTSGFWDGTWKQVAFTFAAGDMRVYADGVDISADMAKLYNDAITSINSSTIPVTIGASFTASITRFMEMGLATAAIWGRALSAGEVQQLHADPDILTRYRNLA